MAQLRAPGGCPWDREQSLATLRTYLIEESHELLDAIDGLAEAGQRDAVTIEAGAIQADPAAVADLREELGDVLLQVAFQSQIARECGWFDLDAVAHGIADKMIRRHPHVFGAATAEHAGEVRDRWEQQKRQEGKGALDGVPKNLPGLLRAQRIGDKAARIGFDWPDASGPWAKIHEEMAELREAEARGDRAAMQDELGDLLFAMANLARHLGVDAELGLRQTLDRFTNRFGHVERQAESRWGREHKASLDELENLWQEAKQLEKLGQLPAAGRKRG
ncbi:MAG: nucleoside triphosphate pyrophosphohydrolase [Deltaproteobacteria bacterium]|nr:nucleoside triphosphate pyrophosphohydrolase [Deltaproteobacteria bacterium]